MSDCVDQFASKPPQAISIALISFIEEEAKKQIEHALDQWVGETLRQRDKELEAMGNTISNLGTRLNGLVETFNKASVQATFTQPMFDQAQQNINRMDMAIDGVSEEVEDLKQQLNELQMNVVAHRNTERSAIDKLASDIKSLQQSKHEMDTIRTHAIEMNARMRAIGNIVDNS